MSEQNIIETEEQKKIRQWAVFMCGIQTNKELGYPPPKEVIDEARKAIFSADGLTTATQM